jgi:hypothetical protein
VNLIWATNTGLTHRQRFMTAGVIPKLHLPLVFSGKLIKGHVVRLSFWNSASMLAKSFSEKPDPTLPEKTSPSGL